MDSMTKTTHRYEEIAGHIAAGIKDGTILTGEKLPSLRKMSRRYGCAISVVMQAYELLERSGMAFAVEKSGYFASLPGSSPSPAPHREKHQLTSEEARPLSMIGRIIEAGNDRRIVPLGAGLPHASLLPLKNLKQNLFRILKEENSLLGEYAGESGLPALRREIGKVMLQRGIAVSSDEILITNGCTEALSLAVQSCSSPGDIIVSESPVFMGIIQILNQLKRRIIPMPTSPEEGVDLNQLEGVLAREEVKAVILTALYQNPLGFVMPEKNRREIIHLAEKYKVTIIEDDIYNQCSYDHSEERPIKSFDTTGRVIYCSSFSKTLSPGLRVGWLAGGRKHEVCRRLKMGLTLGGNPVIQAAVAEYLQSPRYTANIYKLQKALERQTREIKQLIIQHFPRGTAVSKPKGGLYLWVELPFELDCLNLFEQALKEDISFVPGSAFGVNGRYNNCLRISIASPVEEETRNAVEKLGVMLNDRLNRECRL